MQWLVHVYGDAIIVVRELHIVILAYMKITADSDLFLSIVCLFDDIHQNKNNYD